MAEFVRVCSTEDIPVGRMKAFEIGPDRFLVAHTGEDFFAVVDECTHEAVPLSEGRVRGNEILCRAHGAKFDLKTGAVTAPPAIVPIETLEVDVRGDEVYVRIEE
jgi:3-phenylpropionate/trans-cinnamate dioxygenase ferredoxin subunit